MVAQLNASVIKTQPLLVPRRIISYLLFEGRPLTTRGQWINPFLLRFFGLIKNVPSMKKVEKPIFIIGIGRSGSTILGMLFHMHPACGFLNEPKAMWNAIFPDEDLIGSYSRQSAYYRLEERNVTAEIKLRAQRIFGFYLFITGARRVVDKYPEMVFRVPFLKAIFPDARFVFLIRNGYDTIASIAAWSNKNKKFLRNEKHDWWGANDRKWHLLLDQIVPYDDMLSPYQQEISREKSQEARAAVEWITSMREGLKNLARFPDSIFPIHYEQLTQNPRRELLQLVKFCDLEENEVFFSYAEEVLRPATPKSTVPLPDYLREAFEDLMLELGYPKGKFVALAPPSVLSKKSIQRGQRNL